MKERLNIKKARNFWKKKREKRKVYIVICTGLGQQFQFIKNRVKKYGCTKIYLFFTISNAKNLTCISNNQ
jgi:hypothetical protein